MKIKITYKDSCKKEKIILDIDFVAIEGNELYITKDNENTLYDINQLEFTSIENDDID